MEGKEKKTKPNYYVYSLYVQMGRRCVEGFRTDYYSGLEI